ncbi:MAG: threonine synthase [SAR202 cluster bacterium]|nr:threonine synthase [SAR202 cluster bacterium]
MSFVTGLRCRECGRDYPVEPVNVCDFCFGPLEVVYDYKSIAKATSRKRIAEGPLTIWRYQDFLPVDAANAVDIHAGFTPLIKSKNLGRMLGLDNLYIKNDSVNPSYSFKDRVVSVAATKALEFEFDTLSCASTGNLACSVAAHAAWAGMKAVVFIPADLEVGKVIGAAIYGPTVMAVQGNYDDVNRLCSEIADSYRWAFVNVNMRPFYAEGSKTLGLEVAEQLGWRFPDHAVVPVASGALLTKIYRGFNELVTVGLVKGPVHTRMYAAQARGCSPVVDTFLAGEEIVKPVRPNSIAKSLAIGNPADGVYAIRTMKQSKGGAHAIREEEVEEGMRLLAETEGIFTETAGGVVVSSLKALAKKGAFRREDVVVAYITGNGLKTQEVVKDVVRPLSIKPTMKEFEAALHGATAAGR